MAKIIPELPDEFTKSRTEKKLFPLFRGMNDTDDWTILHSLGISKHNIQSQGEIDFVAIIPSQGIFFLEVKGGLISHQNGEWYSKDYYDEVHRIKNPVAEANNAMHSVKENVIASIPELKNVLTGFGVIFSDTTIHGEVNFSEIADEQIADYDDSLSSESLKAYLLRLAAFWRSSFKGRSSAPTAAQCERVVKLLRPDFSGKVALRSLIRSVENQVIELTDNQQNTFDTMTENDRCIVRGNAGTGKTVIALYYAKQMADINLRTGFFCFNKQLAHYLKDNIKEHDGLICDSFTEYMESVVIQSGRTPDPEKSSDSRNRYYRETLPDMFMDAYIELDLPLFDNLILDEAQDLITEEYIAALDLILKGGLKSGKWYFFIDAEKQNIFNSETSESDAFSQIERYGAFYAKSRLQDNCRNSLAIIEKIDRVFGSETRHRHNEYRGAEVEIKSYRNTPDQVEKLETILRTLIREGIPFEHITILSMIRFQNSACSLVTGTPVTTDSARKKEAVYFSTIQGFKGLESPVVILTDIDTLSEEVKMNILYVGMTRAKSALYILAKEEAAKQLR